MSSFFPSTKPGARAAPASAAPAKAPAAAASAASPSPSPLLQLGTSSVGPGASMSELLRYVPARESTATAAELRALEHIAEHYIVAKDFECNTQAYGPLSGTSHVQRLLANWSSGALPLKAGHERVELCADCSGGHWRESCPQKLEVPVRRAVVKA